MGKEELEKQKLKHDAEQNRKADTSHEKEKDERNSADSNAAEMPEKFQVSENWAHEIIEDMDDFIESQGIYLRQ